jgi:trimethylamine---corrinoid protein Co-methyltransferase
MSTARPQLRFLNEDQLDRIHETSLEILERPGMRITTQPARALLAEAGCRIDGEDVSFPRDLVEWAISVAPGDFTWFGREGGDIEFGHNEPHWGAGVTCLSYLDPRDERPHTYTLRDIADVATLVDALPNIDFLATPGVVRATADMPQEIVNQEEFFAMATHTTKPLMVLIADHQELRDIFEMAAIVRGGREALRERPFVIPYLNPVTPGLYNPETLDKLLLAAEWGAPIICQPAPAVGATSPMTLAGTMALANAESLAGLVLAQLANEGNPYIIGIIPMALDMRSGAATAAGPIAPLLQFANVQLARRYGLPIHADGGNSDAKLFDEQATLEATFYAVTSALAGVDIMFDGGCLEAGLLWSPELLVILDEIVDLCRSMMRGFDVDNDALALDVVRDVGIGDIYLGHDHTLAHFREMWLPRLISWDGRTDWEAKGATTLGQRVRARTLELVDTHEVEPIPDDVRAAMREVVEARRRSVAA